MRGARGLLAGLALLCGCVAARAQTGLPPGKPIQLLIGAGSGGGYDLTARMLARHMRQASKRRPSPAVDASPFQGQISQVTQHLQIPT